MANWVRDGFDRGSFAAHGESSLVISLAGRSWKLREIDWKGSKAFVEPAQYGGKSRWLGSGRPYGFELCQEVKLILTTETRLAFLSQRGEDALAEARKEHDWLKADATVFRMSAGGEDSEWWTFAGRKANEHLAKLLIQAASLQNTTDNFSLRFKSAVTAEGLVKALQTIRDASGRESIAAIEEHQPDLKFSECLPPSALRRMSRERQHAIRPVEFILAQPIRIAH